MSGVSLPRIVCIVGPTASGKTALGIRLAEMFRGEVINADARQIYKGFDIGTGKPSDADMKKISHHLYDAWSGTEMVTVVEWREKALSCIQEITQRSILPVLVGGTGLYIQSLVDNYQVPSIPPQPDLRRELEQKTVDERVQLLQKIDSVSAKTIDLKNPRRVLRALEVAIVTGRSFVGERKKGEPLVEACLMGIRRTPEELRTRIRETIHRMMVDGWLEETKKLLQEGISPDVSAMSAIGYREMVSVVKGAMTLAGAEQRIEQATWQYARRQMTWWRRDARIQWVKEEEAEEIVRLFLS